MDMVVMPVEQLRTLMVEACAIALKYNSGTVQSIPNTELEPYGDFKWLTSICPGVPASTLRVKSAAGEIPGVIKFGKRVLYQKADVLNWLQSQTQKGGVSA